MKTALKYLILALGFLALCRISPLGAVVAVLTCGIRCAFKSGAISHFVGMVMHDAFLGVWHWIFGPPRVRIARERPRERPR